MVKLTKNNVRFMIVEGCILGSVHLEKKGEHHLKNGSFHPK